MVTTNQRIKEMSQILHLNKKRTLGGLFGVTRQIKRFRGNFLKRKKSGTKIEKTEIQDQIKQEGDSGLVNKLIKQRYKLKNL